MSRQVSRGSVGEYQADEQAGVARLRSQVAGRWKRCCISDLRGCVCVLHVKSQGVCVCVCVCVCVHVMLCEDGEAGDASETGRTGHAWRKVGCSSPEA